MFKQQAGWRVLLCCTRRFLVMNMFTTPVDAKQEEPPMEQESSIESVLQ